MGDVGNDARRGPVSRTLARGVRTRSRWKAFARARRSGGCSAFSSLFSAYQIWMNPFGFSDLTQRYTQDISNLLITGPYLYPQTGHDAISVALVDDTTLANMQMPWPWSYGAQARALDSLLAYKPRAVIVDILFADPRKDDTLPELIGEIGRFKAAGVPLYFVGATDLPAGTPAIRKELLTRARASSIPPPSSIRASCANTPSKAAA